jgi:LysR family glycine cleavage system transcriptional activator
MTVTMTDASTRVLAPLHFLPAFELAALHLSFKRAAAELHLTPSAVSQQIRALEDALGVQLFYRMTRALQLTEAGEQFATVTADTLSAYRLGTERMLRQHGQRALRLSSDPFLAHEVLIPELHTFNERHSALMLRIETSAELADFARDGIDAAVRYGLGPWPGLAATRLCDVIATAVCAPGLVKGDRLRTPAALARYPLIRLGDRPDPWSRLASALGFRLTREPLVFDTYFASVRAAEKGLGIALGIFPTTSAAVLERRLVTPLAMHFRARAKYQFVCRKEDAERPGVSALRTWCRERFAALPPLPQVPWPCTIVDEE